MTIPPEIQAEAHQLARVLWQSYRDRDFEWPTEEIQGLIAKALMAQRQAWQTMETARRDGSWMLAYWPTLSISEYPAVIFADDCSLHDIWYLARDLDFGPVYPTHWMPLPPPPEGQP